MNSRFTTLVVGAAIGVSGALWQSDAHSATLQDYKSYLISSGYIVSGSQQCAALCASDRQCRSYTVAPAGTYAAQPTCWRLSVVPSEPILIQTGVRQVKRTDVIESAHEPILTHSQPSGTGYHPAPDNAVDYYENSVATTYTHADGHKTESIVPATHNEGKAVASIAEARERLASGNAATGSIATGTAIQPSVQTSTTAFTAQAPGVIAQAPAVQQPAYAYNPNPYGYGYPQPAQPSGYGYASQQPTYGLPNPPSVVQPQGYGYAAQPAAQPTYGYPAAQPQAVYGYGVQAPVQQPAYGYAQPQPQPSYGYVQQPTVTPGYAVPTQLPPVPANNTTVGASFEPGYDRPGYDLRPAFASVSAEQCVSACYADSQCRAFSFNDKAIPGPSGMCTLKSQAGPAQPNDCCTSGVRATGTLPTARTFLQ